MTKSFGLLLPLVPLVLLQGCGSADDAAPAGTAPTTAPFIGPLTKPILCNADACGDGYELKGPVPHECKSGTCNQQDDQATCCKKTPTALYCSCVCKGGDGDEKTMLTAQLCKAVPGECETICETKCPKQESESTCATKPVDNPAKEAPVEEPEAKEDPAEEPEAEEDPAEETEAEGALVAALRARRVSNLQVAPVAIGGAMLFSVGMLVGGLVVYKRQESRRTLALATQEVNVEMQTEP